jgi:hypothetical protein
MINWTAIWHPGMCSSTFCDTLDGYLMVYTSKSGIPLQIVNLFHKPSKEGMSEGLLFRLLETLGDLESLVVGLLL